MSNKSLQDTYNQVCAQNNNYARPTREEDLYAQVYSESTQEEVVREEDLYDQVYTPTINENGQVSLNSAYEQVMLNEALDNVECEKEELYYNIPDKYFDK